MTDNPYASPSPELEADAGPSVSPTSPTLAGIAKPTFLAWERLRVIYIVVLALLTLVLAGPNLARLRTIAIIVEGAIFANICFFAGPIIETYVRWHGYDRKWVRWTLFGGGTLLTAMLALITLAIAFLQDRD